MMPTNGCLGELFISAYNPRVGFLDRELVPFVISDSKWRKKSGDIKVIERKRYGERPISLRKVQVRRRKSLEEIATAVDRKYIEKTGRFLIGAQLEVNGNCENWVSPWGRNFLDFELDEVEKNLQQMRNNGEDPRVIFFYEKLQEMQLADIWLKTGIRSAATVSLVVGEVETFKHGFNRL